MSAEVFGKPDAGEVVSEAAFQAAGIQIVTGEQPDMAFAVGSRGGKYAAELLLAALSELGLGASLEERSQEICDAISVIADVTIHPLHIDFYKQAQEAGLSRGDFDG